MPTQFLAPFPSIVSSGHHEHCSTRTSSLPEGLATPRSQSRITCTLKMKDFWQAMFLWVLSPCGETQLAASIVAGRASTGMCVLWTLGRW